MGDCLVAFRTQRKSAHFPFAGFFFRVMMHSMRNLQFARHTALSEGKSHVVCFLRTGPHPLACSATSHSVNNDCSMLPFRAYEVCSGVLVVVRVRVGVLTSRSGAHRFSMPLAFDSALLLSAKDAYGVSTSLSSARG